MSDYFQFLERKSQLGTFSGFEPNYLPDFLFPFQRGLVDWAVRKGKAAIFADCGLGKTPMQLVWAENVVRKCGRPVLIVTPLAVSLQVIHEAEKFGIECRRESRGEVRPTDGIVVTNYERLHLFDQSKFVGMVCDESSILKNFDGARKAAITEFFRMLPYRLLCTATAAPNDYVELGTSSEALGELGHMDMLLRFFKNDQNSLNPTSGRGRWERGMHTSANKWRFKHHAEDHFWRWVCSWAMAVRRPSDLGFQDEGFVLPPLEEVEHIIETETKRDGMLFNLPAVGLKEEREERRRTIRERCERLAALVERRDEQSLVWVNLNDEADLLEELIPDAQQVSGSDSDDAKEEKLTAFAQGKLRVLVTKPKIGAWGLNLQNCAHVLFFPTHSYEQYYQGIRRCWRFGQKKPVRVDIVATTGEREVMQNLSRKARMADQMFDALVRHMNDSIRIDRSVAYEKEAEVPVWL
jgi:hypothetical protein